MSMRSFSKAVHYGAIVNRFNFKALVMSEYLIRQVQLQEDVVSENPEFQQHGATHNLFGSDIGFGGGLSAPSLRRHDSSQLGREAAIAEWKRKPEAP